jgi:hypothetical protein
MDGVEQIDVSGKTINHRNLDLPPGLRNQAVKRVDRGQNGEVVVINNQAKNLLIIREDGQNVEIKDGAGRSIERFGLAKHSDRLAYVVNEGPNNELWINNLSGSVPKNLRRLDFHSVQHILWMPDNQTILIGWAEAGTNSQTFLFWLDSETGEEVPVGVHGIAQDLILNHTANKLFYTLSIKDTLDGSEQTTIYQLQIGQSTKFVNSDSIMA